MLVQCHKGIGRIVPQRPFRLQILPQIVRFISSSALDEDVPVSSPIQFVNRHVWVGLLHRIHPWQMLITLFFAVATREVVGTAEAPSFIVVLVGISILCIILWQNLSRPLPPMCTIEF